MYLLDTNVVSELRKAGTTHAHDGVIRWASGLDTQSLYLSVITTMELEIGVLRIARRDAAQGEALRSWFDDQVLRAFADRVLPIDQAVVSRCASMHVPDPKSDRDAFIGATALEHGLTVATRNVKDFAGLGVDLLDPWNNYP